MNGPVPAIDYTDLGYESMRRAMLDLARERLPEWTDLSENDVGVLLVELFAYACDVTLYYQSRIAANLLPETSDEPEALVQLLRLIGYELRPPAPATVSLRVALDAARTTPLDIPRGTRFYVALPEGRQLVYEAARRVTIQPLVPPGAGLRWFFPVPVVQGETVTDDPVGVSDGSPNQMFPLVQHPARTGSIEVTVREPGGDTHWERVETLAYSTPADRHFTVQRDSSGRAVIVFGDGENGIVPPEGSSAQPVSIKAVYMVGGDEHGNVPSKTVFRTDLTDIKAVENPYAAAGGAPAEELDRARRLAPRLFRAQDRAVTEDDFVDLALQVPGVGKARAVALAWNHVLLYVAPTGQVTEPSELLVRDLYAFFETRRMASTPIEIVGPSPADIYLRATVQAEPYFLQTDVRAVVEAAVADYFAFERIQFGEPVFLSRIYDAIQSLEQVRAVNITQFARRPTGTVMPNGVIELDPDELARPGYRDNAATPPDPSAPTIRPPIALTIQGGVA